MQVILEIIQGPAVGRKIALQIGELARFGSSESADVYLPGDRQLSPVHFEIESRTERCVLRDRQGNGGTWLNDQQVAESGLSDGDVILAGQTHFRIHINHPLKTASDGDRDEHDEEVTSIELTPSLYDLCAGLELSEDARALLLPDDDASTYVEKLVKGQLFDDALRVVAFYLGKRDAIRWACRSVESLGAAESGGATGKALEAVKLWLDDPTDENRRAAHAAAEADEFTHAACWVALAAFWSEGSIAPPDLSEVPPADNLSGQGVVAALLLAATHGEPNQVDERYRHILDLGQEFIEELTSQVDN